MTSSVTHLATQAEIQTKTLVESIVKKEIIVGRECRFAIFCDNKTEHDLHVVKEYIYTEDSVRKPRINLVWDYKREFYITREGYRDHEEKKEAEEIEKVQRYTCTQSKMVDAISRALHKRPAAPRTRLRQLCDTPYIYGVDISSTALLKKAYQKRWPDYQHPTSSVAVLDIETDVVNGTKEIILITLSFKDKIVTAINNRFINRVRDPVTNVKRLIDKHLSEEMKKRNANVEIVVFDKPGQCCAHVIKRAHEWMPDFITVWNINFDMPIIIKALEKERYDLAEVFSDPAVPPEYRFFNYKEGSAQKVTQDGTVMSKHPADRWHVVQCPASFYFMDSMCLYKRLRLAKGNDASYSLDFILNKHGIRGKLSVPECDNLKGLLWHKKMQKDHPFFYVVYNIYDCMSVEFLDEKTTDLGIAFHANCGNSDYDNFTSNPRRIMDDLHYFFLERNHVVGATGDDMVDENDEYVVSLSDWIVTLPADNMDDNGIPIIREFPSIRSMMRIHNADLDVKATYPTEQITCNISKRTTSRELSSIVGFTERERRIIGLNLTGGVSNALEISNMVYKMPTLLEWGAIADKAIMEGRL